MSDICFNLEVMVYTLNMGENFLAATLKHKMLVLVSCLKLPSIDGSLSFEQCNRVSLLQTSIHCYAVGSSYSTKIVIVSDQIHFDVKRSKSMQVIAS